MRIFAELLTGSVLTPAVLIAAIAVSVTLLSGLGAEIADRL